MTDRCKNCGSEVTGEEIGLTKKLVNRGATEFLCSACLMGYYGLTEENLRAMAERFRAQGCLLFKT